MRWERLQTELYLVLYGTKWLTLKVATLPHNLKDLNILLRRNVRVRLSVFVRPTAYVDWTGWKAPVDIILSTLITMPQHGRRISRELMY